MGNSLQNQVTKAYYANKLVGICAYCINENSEKPFHWLSGKEEVGGLVEVAMKIPIENYQRYLYGMCREHHQIEYLQSLDENFWRFFRRK